MTARSHRRASKAGRYFAAACCGIAAIFANAWVVMFAAGFANHDLRHLFAVPAISYNTSFLLACLYAVMNAPPLLAWVLIERALR